MKTPREGESWFFVDESGDPTFYDHRGNYIVGQSGCSPILILGFITTHDPHTARKAILELQRNIIADRYFEHIPSITKTANAFHAKDDTPEVRYLFYKLLSSLNYKAQFIVARKIERVFRNNFNSKETMFYDHLTSLLLQNCLHKCTNNYVYLSQRGSRDRQAPLANAIKRGIRRFEKQNKTSVVTNIQMQTQTPKGEPCLSIIDYMNWAVYRAYTKGEMRYYKFIEDKVSFLMDIYDHKKHPKNKYHRKHPFDVGKATPL